MSKTNYSNFSRPTVEEKIEPVVKEVIEEVVAEEPTTEQAPQTEKSEKSESTVGVVSNCAKLRVRKAPNVKAEVLCEIANLSAVVIEPTKSTEDFYKVCTENGVEGYCMKKFITVKA